MPFNTLPPVPLLKTSSLKRGDDVELARVVQSRLKNGPIQLVGDYGAIYRYCGDLWRKLPVDYLARAIHALAGSEITGTERPQVLQLTANRVSGAITSLQYEVAQPGFFDEAPLGVAFDNGFVHYDPMDRTLEFHEHDHDWRATWGLPYRYAAQPTPHFNKFVESLFKGTRDSAAKVQLILEFVGACLTRTVTRFQRVLAFTGEGANGKSELLKVISALFPTEAVTAIPPQSWGREYERAKLAGVVLNIVEELAEAEILSSENFKAIVGGSSKISGRSPYGQIVEYIPTAGHIFAANRMPGTADRTRAFWRRWTILPFENTFEGANADPEVGDRIIASELPGIAYRAIQAAHHALRRNTLTIPRTSEDALDAWKQEADHVLAFLTECTIKTNGPTLTSNTLYTVYRAWCEESGYKPMAKNRFGGEVTRLTGQPIRSDGKTFRALRFSSGGMEFVPQHNRE